MSTNFNRKPEKYLGLVTSGSLSKGLQVRIRSSAPLEHIQTGQFVAIESNGVRFFGMLTDVALEATTDSILLDPPGDDTSALVREVLQGVYTYGDAHVDNRLALYQGDANPRPVRSIPAHFTSVYIAEETDFDAVFGSEDLFQGGKNFAIGKPLDMEIDICIDLERFVERSNGIFGKSGTGKSFLTRLLLAGLIRADICSNLIFDMHNEYGEQAQAENKKFVKGLRSLFSQKVQVWSLKNTRLGGSGSIDGEIFIGLNQIEVEDILLLQDELNLNATASESAYILKEKYGDKWIVELLNGDPEQIATDSRANIQSVKALRNKLHALKNLPFVVDHSSIDSVNQIVDNLARGKHIVIQFGKSDNMLSYILVANIVTRIIHEKYKDKVDQYRQSQKASDEPRRVMITIEEAHKFLTPAVAGQTIFGTIAREMRKYYVTLLVVDQRPSSIDSEIMSQIGTRVVALINDERDIDAVFTGVSGSSGLKTVLASLDSKQQALVLGHAAPMPVVIRTRPYDEAFYKQIISGLELARSTVDWDDLDPDSQEEARQKAIEEVKDLYG
ncbi:ATP-binding protein [Candidatus Chlorohelix sp.]|uniref:ATP-binding protein n=1 Tax=Candidatus Chlorohelix sp. TaxID=3139201 RepID=UPI003042A045